MTDDRWTKIWEAFTGDPMDPNNNTEAGLRRVVELLDGTPAPETHLRVKPLGWVSMGNVTFASTPFGSYEVEENETARFGDDAFSLKIPGEKVLSAIFATEDLGRAAAQADYHHRVMSALQDNPSPESREMGINEK